MIYHGEQRIESPADWEKLAEQYGIPTAEAISVGEFVSEMVSPFFDDYGNPDGAKALYANLSRGKEGGIKTNDSNPEIIQHQDNSAMVATVVGEALARSLGDCFTLDETGEIHLTPGVSPTLAESYMATEGVWEICQRADQIQGIGLWKVCNLIFLIRKLHGDDFDTSRMVEMTGKGLATVNALVRVGDYFFGLGKGIPPLNFSTAKNIILSGKIPYELKDVAVQCAHKHNLKAGDIFAVANACGLWAQAIDEKTEELIEEEETEDGKVAIQLEAEKQKIEFIREKLENFDREYISETSRKKTMPYWFFVTADGIPFIKRGNTTGVGGQKVPEHCMVKINMKDPQEAYVLGKKMMCATWA